jgi:superfamily I DNA and/or RNA helicase
MIISSRDHQVKNKQIKRNEIFNLMDIDFNYQAYSKLYCSSKKNNAKVSEKAKSKTNELEAEFVAKIFIQAVNLKGDGNFYKGLKVIQGQIGIITPYKSQSYLIRDKISKQIMSLQNTKSKNTKMYAFEQPDSDEVINIDKIVQISTVDSFQGREKDTIIIS